MTDLKFSSIREALHFRMTVSEDHYFDVLLDLCLKCFYVVSLLCRKKPWQVKKILVKD